MQLAKCVSVYQAADGSQHEKPHKAAQATRDLLCERLNSMLHPLLMAGKITASERYELVNTLAGTDVAISNLLSTVLPVLNWIADSTEEDQDNDTN